ncbi:aspartate dehydrogenase [Paraburkholderia phenoliruptrix]|uniref:L-aspartate dehydrogenase n=2 Tax=Paraburkholderia phenoliruptrix TaxID=252970 RepID=K0E3D5_9BURK|nr:aspartate dehydrogenase [Paraburkholderia phenoliruptrix]AFT90294.1 putative L-aspartate dehydrogenase [Paraburkholderia phenoliruptrix BR3459a]CAB4051713.1 L-aspartate dehydrogenase [Paraburkholderia phenoliruptrix]
MKHSRFRVAVIGAGAIGRSFAQSVLCEPMGEISFLDLREPPEFLEDARYRKLSSIHELVAWRPNVVVECAGHNAVATIVPQVLKEGFDVVLSSVGALADAGVRSALSSSAVVGGSRLIPIAGAVGGIDALAAAARSGLTEVMYTGRKPPRAWRGTAAEQEFDLDALMSPQVIFTGTAEEAALKYPANANVAATIAIHGLGFEKTAVTLIADPTIRLNCHEIYAKSRSGELRVNMSNEPSPENPRTSWLAALSLQQTVINKVSGVQWIA